MDFSKFSKDIFCKFPTILRASGGGLSPPPGPPTRPGITANPPNFPAYASAAWRVIYRPSIPVFYLNSSKNLF